MRQVRLVSISVGQVAAAGRFSSGSALQLLAIARYGASLRLDPNENHLRHV
jgi:hypothetical protein